MIISGVVIDVEPAQGPEAAAALRVHPGVTAVDGPISPGRLVAVVEAADEAAMEALMSGLLATPGIVAVNPASIHFES